MGPNISNHRQGYLGSSCKSSTLLFKSSKVQLKFEDHLRVLLLDIQLHAASRINFVTMVQLS